MPVKIFFCYAHEDEPLLKKLKLQLTPMQRQGLIEVWHDHDINAGTEWEREISEQLNAAQIILLLVSPDFMASDYCYGIEMKRAMERHKQGEVIVIPIILRWVRWQGTPISELQALPKEAKPIKSWQDEDEAFYDVVEGIYTVVSEIITKNGAMIVPIHDRLSLEEQVSLWIEATASKSIVTKKTYESIIKNFRIALRKHSLDLNSEEAASISSLLQEWASRAERRSSIKPNTYNHRIHIVRSFYKFALVQHWIKINPIEKVELREIGTVNSAKPLDFEGVKSALKSIPRFTLEGKRDYALLCILLTTGGRATEIAGLRCGNVAIAEGSVTITTRQKGNREMKYTLQKGTAQALVDYLTALYGNKLSPGNPIWLSFSHNRSKGFPISNEALGDVCQKYLEISKVEVTRKTYLAMKDMVGVTGIEKKLDIDAETTPDEPGFTY